ncbi:MAG: hypothetical protein ACXQS8_06810 [Candidatus Helarchaeales archaeon]
MTYNFTAEIQDELIDALNDFDITESGVSFKIKSYRAEEVSKVTVPRIYVDFISEFAPIKRFVGNILGRYPSSEITHGGNLITIPGNLIEGYPCKTIAYISVICHEKKAHGFDANRLLRNLMEKIIIKIHKEWPPLLKKCKAQLEGPIGPITPEPFFIGPEKVYRYTVRFDIIHTFVWTEPETSTDGTGYICEISGGIYDNSDNFIEEFKTR